MTWLFPVWFGFLWLVWKFFTQRDHHAHGGRDQNTPATESPTTRSARAEDALVDHGKTTQAQSITGQSDLATDVDTEPDPTTQSELNPEDMVESLSLLNVRQPSAQETGANTSDRDTATAGPVDGAYYCGDFEPAVEFGPFDRMRATETLNIGPSLLTEEIEVSDTEYTAVKSFNRDGGRPDDGGAISEAVRRGSEDRQEDYTDRTREDDVQSESEYQSLDVNDTQESHVNWTRGENVNVCITNAKFVNISSPTTPTDHNPRFFAKLSWDEERIDEHPEMRRVREELDNMKRQYQELNTKNQELNTQLEATGKRGDEREQKAAQEKEHLLTLLEKLSINKERHALLEMQQESAEVNELKKQLEDQKKNQTQLKERIQDLHTTVVTNDDQAKKNAEERGRLIMLVQQFADERAATEKKLDELRSQHATEKEVLSQRYEEKIEKEHEQVSTFVVRLEERDKKILEDVILKLQEGKRLAEVADRLDKDLNVRLLGVDCGLGFVMKATAADWESAQSKEPEIQNILRQYLSDGAKFQEMRPSSMDEDEGDLDQPLPEPPAVDRQELTVAGDTRDRVQQRAHTKAAGTDVSGAAFPSAQTSGGDAAHLGPTKRKVERQFTVHPTVERRHGTLRAGTATKPSEPIVMSLASTDTGRVYMADMTKYHLMYFHVDDPNSVKSVSLTVAPMFLAITEGDEVAVSSVLGDAILLVSIGRSSTITQIHPERKYDVVARGADDTLIVSCWKTGNDPARIDVITRTGDLVRPVCDGHSVPDLCKPQSLCVIGDEVLVADKPSDAILRIRLSTGTLLAKHTHLYLSKPVGIAADREGSIYVASSGTSSVLVMSADGRWRKLLTETKDGARDFVIPTSVALTREGLVVSWMTTDNKGSIVIGYSLADP